MGFWCSSPLTTIFQLYRDDYAEKTTDLSQVTDKFYNIMSYRVHLAMNGVQTLNCCGDNP